MQYQKSGADVLELAQAVARESLSRVQAKTGFAVRLLTFEELAQTAKGWPHDATIQAIASDDTLDLPERAKRLTERVWKLSGLQGPAVVLGFGSIPYLAVSLKDAQLRSSIEAAVKPLGIGALNYFAGISDMSFLGEARGDLSVVAANTPVWGTSFDMPEAAGLPIINLGPWGRDYHQWLERLHAPYAFETLPKALLAVIEAVA